MEVYSLVAVGALEANLLYCIVTAKKPKIEKKMTILHGILRVGKIG